MEMTGGHILSLLDTLRSTRHSSASVRHHHCSVVMKVFSSLGKRGTMAKKSAAHELQTSVHPVVLQGRCVV